MSTLRTMLAIGDDECAAAGLLSLSPPEISAQVRRWSPTNPCPSKELAERERAWTRVRRLARTGLSIREISKRTGIASTTVYRLLKSVRPKQIEGQFFLRGIEFSVAQVFQNCRHLVERDCEERVEVLAPEHGVADAIQPTPSSEPIVACNEVEVAEVAVVPTMAHDPRDAARLVGRGKAAQAARAAEAAWAALAEIPDEDERVAVLGVLRALQAERTFLTVRGAVPTKARPTHRVPASVVARRFQSRFAALDAAMKAADEAWLTAIERQAARTKRITAVLDRWEFGEALRGQTDEDVLRIVGRRAGEARQLWLGLSAAALARASKLAGRAVRLRDCDEAMKHRRALASVLKADRDQVRRAGLDHALTTQCLALLWPDAPAPAPPPARMADARDFARPPVVPFHAMVARLRAMSADVGFR